MAQDPEYVSLTKARQAEFTRKHIVKRSATLEEIKERAKTNPQAAEDIEAIREKWRVDARKSYSKKKADSEKIRPSPVL